MTAIAPSGSQILELALAEVVLETQASLLALNEHVARYGPTSDAVGRSVGATHTIVLALLDHALALAANWPIVEVMEERHRLTVCVVRAVRDKLLATWPSHTVFDRKDTRDAQASTFVVSLVAALAVLHLTLARSTSDATRLALAESFAGHSVRLIEGGPPCP